MEIWKDNEIKRYKDNVTYAYDSYISSRSSEDWDKFWEAFKILLKETNYVSKDFFSQDRSSYYFPFKENKSIFDFISK